MFAAGCQESGHEFILIGDRASPKDFHLDGCTFYNLEAQKKCGLRFAEICPERSYSRKNVGYLLAARNGAEVILETDDDNIPLQEFWNVPIRKPWAPTIEYSGWINVY